MQNFYRLAAVCACVLGLDACQMPPAGRPTAMADPPGATSFPEGDVIEGVKAFKSVRAKSGMVGVGKYVAVCQRSVAQGAASDLIRQCFAYEMSAMLVSAAHDNRLHSAPLPNLSQADFQRRFDGYCNHLGIPVNQRMAVTDGLFRQVYPRIGA